MSNGLSNEEVRSLYVRYGHLVLRRCRRILQDPALAEDAVQEVFLKSLRYGASVRAADSELAWLYRVVDNCCFTLLESRKSTRLPLRALPEQAQAQPSRADDSWHGVLAGLSEPERSAAILLYTDGLTQGEVSKRLGRSRQTINKYVRAIRRLALKMLNETA